MRRRLSLTARPRSAASGQLRWSCGFRDDDAAWASGRRRRRIRRDDRVDHLALRFFGELRLRDGIAELRRGDAFGDRIRNLDGVGMRQDNLWRRTQARAPRSLSLRLSRRPSPIESIGVGGEGGGTGAIVTALLGVAFDPDPPARVGRSRHA
jgi:hypothetical protein